MSVTLLILCGFPAMLMLYVGAFISASYVFNVTNCPFQGLFWGLIGGVVAYFATFFLIAGVAELVSRGSMLIN